MSIGVCKKIDACMPQLHAVQPKSGQFIRQFSWVTSDPIGLKGLNVLYYNCTYIGKGTRTRSVGVQWEQNLTKFKVITWGTIW